jgi:hypothetical protein
LHRDKDNRNEFEIDLLLGFRTNSCLFSSIHG